MRIGVLGGTFDPPHVGHLIVASDVCAALALDRLLFIPAAAPPHKRGRVRASPALRLEMVRAATADDPRFEVDDLELRREGESYSADTLRQLREREPDVVARLATLVVVSRAGEEGGLGGEVAFPVRPVQVTRIDLSATEIRRRVRDGEPIRYLVPDSVREIIEREGLYA
jgi:nicotinate-nucleotide adenylyltransferase